MQNELNRQQLPPSDWVDRLAGGRDTLSTRDAAYAMNLQPQTLRNWYTQGSSLVRSVRRGSRREWLVEDIKRYLGLL